MDKCQPISVRLQNGNKVFFLLVEDQDLIDQNDPEHFYCASSHYVAPAVFFRSAAEALDDAYTRIQAISPIANVLPTLGFEEFFTHQDLVDHV